MTKQEIELAARRCLAMNLGCDEEVLERAGNTVIEWRPHPGRQRLEERDCFLEIVLWHGRLYAACAPVLLPWAREFLASYPAPWLFTAGAFRSIEAALAPHGWEIGSAHHFYLPDPTWLAASPLLPVRWYEADELEQFRGDPRWKEALGFIPGAPDILAATALDPGGAPIAMAACSRDWEKMWQIGINVEPSWRGQGLGSDLTALLKDEILRRGAIPFYGTSESHIASQNTARRAGFYPAWAYLYAKPIPKGTN